MEVWARKGEIVRARLRKVFLFLVGVSAAVAVGAVVSRWFERPHETDASFSGGVETEARRQLVHSPVSFRFKSEEALSHFVCPGYVETNEETIKAIKAAFISDIDVSLQTPIRIHSDDDANAVLMKRIVSGMKEEVRMRIAAGEGANEAFDWLIERQRMEAEYRIMLIRGVRAGSHQEIDRQIGKVNASLRLVGMREIDDEERKKIFEKFFEKFQKPH